MECPRCHRELQAEEYEGVQVERCPGCQGFWIGGTRLAAIIDARERTFSVEEIATYREIHEAHRGMVHPGTQAILCPQCGSELQQNRYNYAAEVLLDRCPQGHGTWLDKGELEHIQMAVEEEEGELHQVIKEKGLKMDNFASTQLKHEQGKYRFRFWRFFFWRDG